MNRSRSASFSIKQGKAIVVLGALLAANAALWYWNGPQVSVPSVRDVLNGPANESSLMLDGLALHSWGDRASSHATEYRNSGRNPIATSGEQARTNSTDRLARITDKGASARPAKADMSLKFYGYGTVPNGTPRRAYLSNGSEVYIVAEGDVVLGRYRILKIDTTAVEFEDTSLHLRGQKTLESSFESSISPPTT